MITRLYRSKSDIENLSRVRTVFSEEPDTFDYKRLVVQKPWGYEYLMYENQYVAIWMLYLKENHQTSMHAHPNKKTSLLVIKGEVMCSTLEGFMSRSAGDGLVIESSVFHSTRATSKGGAIVMEIESPPNKSDLVRLKDAYGREGTGYESVSQMSRDVDKYEYIDFHGVNPKKRKTMLFGACVMSLCVHKAHKTIHTRLKHENGDILCLLAGSMHDNEGKKILIAGEAADVTELRKISRICAFDAIIYLTISHTH
jgi:mannose-6-phosphate isomerase-like protein (cupin superfamily)